VCGYSTCINESTLASANPQRIEQLIIHVERLNW